MKLTRLSSAVLLTLFLFQQVNAAENNTIKKPIVINKQKKVHQDKKKKISKENTPIPEQIKTKTRVVSFYTKKDITELDNKDKNSRYNKDYYTDTKSLSNTPLILNRNPSGGLPPESLQNDSFLANWMAIMSETINR